MPVFGADAAMAASEKPFADCQSKAKNIRTYHLALQPQRLEGAHPACQPVVMHVRLPDGQGGGDDQIHQREEERVDQPVALDRGDLRQDAVHLRPGQCQVLALDGEQQDQQAMPVQVLPAVCLVQLGALPASLGDFVLDVPRHRAQFVLRGVQDYEDGDGQAEGAARPVAGDHGPRRARARSARGEHNNTWQYNATCAWIRRAHVRRWEGGGEKFYSTLTLTFNFLIINFTTMQIQPCFSCEFPV